MNALRLNKRAVTFCVPAMTLSIMTGCATARPPAEPPLTLTPLVVSASRLERDAFGKSVNPFPTYGHDVVPAGTYLLINVRPSPEFQGELDESKCRLLKLVDDKGSDLLVETTTRDSFFTGNKNLVIQRSRNGDSFGLTLRGNVAPIHGASRIIADGVVAFYPTGSMDSAEHLLNLSKTGEVVRVGPVQLTITEMPPRSNATYRSSSATNDFFAGFFGSSGTGTNTQRQKWNPGKMYMAKLITDPGCASVAAEIIATTEGSKSTTYLPVRSALGGPGAGPTTTSGSFESPSNATVRIRIKSAKPGSLREVPFHIETGIGP